MKAAKLSILTITLCLAVCLCGGAFAQDGPYFVRHDGTYPWPDDDYDRMFYPVDFDSDGDLDFVVTTNMSRVSPTTYAPIMALRNDGGVLSDATEVILGCPGMISGGMCAVADFTGDGRDDVFFAGAGLDMDPFGGEQSRILVQTADGNLNDETSTRLPVTAAFGHECNWGDIDGDGDIDIFVIFDYSVGRMFLLNDGSGVFTISTAGYPAEVQWSHTIASALLDVENDGDLDLYLGGNIHVDPDWLLLNNGSGVFTFAPGSPVPNHRLPTSEVGAGHVIPADYDQDGYVDLALLNWNVVASVGAVQLLLNNGDGSFRDSSDSFNEPTGPMAAADVNGDGLTDLVTGDWPVLWLSAGNGEFINASSLVAYTGYVWYPGDYDLDGDVDLMAMWYQHGGPGTYDYTFWENVRNYDLTTGDIDGDGITDANEARDLDGSTPGVQNPFDPDVADATGDNGQDTPDGRPDGNNDYDGDGMSNRDEFTFGSDPLDPGSLAVVPLFPITGCSVLVVLMFVAVLARARRQRA